MKSSSLILMGIAVVAVGMFALPSTVSLFSGQHQWYDISGSNALPCKKCHADVYEELCSSGFHKWNGGNFSQGGSGTPDDAACYGCHRANSSVTYANIGTSAAAVTPGKQAHAASTVACMLCHQFNASDAVGSSYWNKDLNVSNLSGFPAGGFANPYTGTVLYNYTNQTHKGGYAAHQKFIEDAINWSLMEDSNEACIACHTHVPVNITWRHAHDIEFVAYWNESLTLPPTHFSVDNFSANGTVYNASYGYGNGTGSSGGPNNTPPPGW